MTPNTDADETDSIETKDDVTLTPRDDIVWFVKGKHTEFRDGPFESPADAIQVGRERRDEVGEPTETYHRQRKHLSDGEREHIIPEGGRDD